MSGPIRVTNVITGLELGGAEVIMQRLLGRVDRARFTPQVISLTGRGPLAELVESDGTPVEALGLRSVPGPLGVARLGAALRRSRPDVVQTWLLHSNVLAGALARAGRMAPVAWSMHMIAADAASYSRSTVRLQRIEARLSGRIPARIIACSAGTWDLLREGRYEMSRAELVPNGFDVEAMRPDPAAAAELRAELGIAAGAPVVAHVARFHPAKDHRTLLTAAARALERVPEAVFVLCGQGVDAENAELVPLAAPLGDSIRLLGPRADVTRIFQAADLAVLSSISEAMPLVVGEAMACGTPVVATDTGDTADLVGETGRIVAPGDPQALGAALAEMLSAPRERRRELGEAARRRIAERFSLRTMVAAYESAWSELAEIGRAPARAAA